MRVKCIECGKYFNDDYLFVNFLNKRIYCNNCLKKKWMYYINDIYKTNAISFYQVYLMGKPITIWANEEEEKLLKKLAKEQNRTLSNFIKTKCGVFKKKK